MSELADDPRMKEDLGARLSLIVWWPVVEVLEGYDPEFSKWLSPPNASRFPDGSVCIDRTEIMLPFWLRLHPFREAGLALRQNTLFRSLSCFPRREFQLLSTEAYFERIGGEGDFLVLPTPAVMEVDPNEQHPDKLRVQIQFWKRPNKRVIREFSDALQAWQQSSTGVTGSEGAPGLVDPVPRSDGSGYWSFYVDVSRSGQASINWLVLSVLNFGAKVNPVSEILFAQFCGDEA